mgnify:CR=1 FL=1
MPGRRLMSPIAIDAGDVGFKRGFVLINPFAHRSRHRPRRRRFSVSEFGVRQMAISR